MTMKISERLAAHKGKPILLHHTLSEGTVAFSTLENSKIYFTTSEVVHKPTVEDVHKWLPTYGDLMYDLGLITWGKEQ